MVKITDGAPFPQNPLLASQGKGRLGTGPIHCMWFMTVLKHVGPKPLR
jgi:hypothetical protein